MSAVTVSNGKEMNNALKHESFDIIILDLMLQGENGLTLCRNLREKSNIPILMLTARGESMDRVVGLEVGADDYVVKPFEPRELVARIQTILRRSQRSNSSDISTPNETEFNGWRLNRISRQLVSPKQLVIPLSNSEFRLLSTLIENPNRVLSRDFLIDAARGRNMAIFDRSIDILVSRLRQKLSDDHHPHPLIKTVRGEGYLFDASVIR